MCFLVATAYFWPSPGHWSQSADGGLCVCGGGNAPQFVSFTLPLRYKKCGILQLE